MRGAFHRPSSRPLGAHRLGDFGDLGYSILHEGILAAEFLSAASAHSVQRASPRDASTSETDAPPISILDPPFFQPATLQESKVCDEPADGSLARDKLGRCPGLSC